MRLLSFLRASLRDAHRFGIGALRRHFAPGPTFAIHIRGFGLIHMRKGSLDLDLARIVLVEGAYGYPWPTAAADRLRKRYRTILEAGRTPVIVNAGGYIGFSALWFAREWPEAEIVSVEPDPGNLELLHRNLAGRSRHTIVEAAIGSAPGTAALSGDPEGCAVQTKRARHGVEIVTVDDAVARVQNGAPFICNIDIEGFEKDLFAANTGWIDGFALVIIEPHDWREPGAMISQNFQREMAALPFEIYPRRDTLYYLHA